MCLHRLDSLGQPAEGLPGAAVAEQILLIARLCSAVATDSRFLQVILGPADAWRQAAGASSHLARMQALRSAGGQAKSGAGGVSRMTQVMDKFRASSMAGYK